MIQDTTGSDIMLIIKFLLLPLTLLGHLAIWVFIYNRLHAMAISYRTTKFVNKLIVVFTLAIPITAGLAVGNLGFSGAALSGVGWSEFLLGIYALCCWMAALYVISVWAWRKATMRTPDALVSNDTRVVDVARQLASRPTAHWSTKLLDRIPGNEMFHLAINDKVVILPGLNPGLDGLTIAHLSDFHFSGRIAKTFFQRVIEQANEFDADIVAVTGDLVEKQHFVEWIPETLGQLKSRYGVFYVLGNHDRRVRDVQSLHRTLSDCGLTAVGGRWTTVNVRGESMLIAGNECPWFGSRQELDSQRPEAETPFGLRLLLAHTPDQIPWARSRGFDLMLAGHNHGGQIRLPVIGPIVAPSHSGVKYASGVFCESPTLIHVSRGISGLHPIRLNCTPEITKLILKCE